MSTGDDGQGGSKQGGEEREHNIGHDEDPRDENPVVVEPETPAPLEYVPQRDEPAPIPDLPKTRIHTFWSADGEHTPWLRRIFIVLFALFVPVPILLILIFRFVPVPFTPEMIIPLVKGEGVHYRWVARSEIAPALTRAVIASEDNDFCTHHGFDWKDIHDAIKEHEHGKRLRGASTISQETARTLFLFPVRSWVRKGVEAYFTVLLEFLWPKERILTAYLNLVDWGHGNFGAEAASQTYFHKSASQLSTHEAARLAVILADPDVWNAARPGRYVASRAGTILARMGEVTRDGLDWCVKQ